MSRNWPQFTTKDLGDSETDAVELQRRWRLYDEQMKQLIAAGGVHQDEDGWWVDDASGDLIGPDPEIERPLTDDDLKSATSFAEAFPHLVESIRRTRGRPRVPNAKQAITLRLDPEVVERFKAQGDDWRTRMAQALKDAS